MTSCCGKYTYAHLTNIEINEFGSLMSDKAPKVSTHKTMPSIKLGKYRYDKGGIEQSRNCTSYVEGYCCSNFALIAVAISCSVVKLAIASCPTIIVAMI